MRPIALSGTDLRLIFIHVCMRVRTTTAAHLLVHKHVQMPVPISQIGIPQAEVRFGQKLQTWSKQSGVCGEKTQFAALIAAREALCPDHVPTLETVFAED
jgi:hypothetical protein